LGFLQRVLREKRDEVAEKMRRRPALALRDSLGATPVRDFRCALAPPSRDRTPIVAELKARTPTVAGFAQSDSLPKLAQTYEANGAAAISIVTDERNFGTSLDDVRGIRRTVSIPVLVKDFVVDPYQILEARSAGADAVLLIVRILDPERLTRFLELVHQLGMSALVETHNEAEVETALRAGAPIVGINNRDLDTLEISLDVTRRLAALVPDDVILVSESGICARDDIETLASAGATAFLVGGTLLDADDPGATLRGLLGGESPPPTRQRNYQRR
jgi:indole-3-glycerol phosphate synthase